MGLTDKEGEADAPRASLYLKGLTANLGTLRLLLGAAYLCSGAVVISRLGPMVGTVVVAVSPPGPSAQMAIAEAAGPCPEDTAFCRERNPPMPTRGANGLTFKKKGARKATNGAKSMGMWLPDLLAAPPSNFTHFEDSFDLSTFAAKARPSLRRSLESRAE